MNILLTGTRHHVALGTARRLHKLGHVVYSADSIDFDYTGFSLAVKKRFEMPPVRFAEKKYIDRLIQIIQEYKIDKLVPLGEEIFYISRNIREIRTVNPKLIVEADDIKKLDRLHNKELFSSLARSLGIKIPNSSVVTSLGEIIEYQEKINPDIVLKPVYSRFADHLLHFENVKETKIYFSNASLVARYVLQDFISGENISSFSLDCTAKVITYHSDVEMRRPGAMSSVIRVETPEAIEMADRRIRKALNFKYQLGLDFIQTSSGELYLLEANPRATIGRLLIEKNRAQFRIMAFHQFLNKMILRSSYPRFFKNLLFYPDAVSKWSDPLPVLVSQIGCVGLLSYLRFRKKYPGSSFQAYSTFDMEYNGDIIEYETDTLTGADNEKILALLEGLSTKQSFHLAQTRRPDPIKSFLSDGDKVTIAVVKAKDEIAYLGVCAENKFFVTGSAQAIGYISSIRKNPAFLYRVGWRDALYGYFKEQHKNVKLFLFAIMADNTHAIKSLTRSTDSAPPARLICKYKAFIVNARRFKTKKLPRLMEFSQLGKNDLGEAVAFLKKEGRKNELFPEISNLRDNFLGATINNSFVMKKKGRIVGFASILDQTHKKQFFVKKYAKWVRAVKRPFNLISRPMKLITMPDENLSINCPVVSLCVVENNDPNLYDLLLCQVSAEVKKQSDIFTVSMAINNPCINTLSSWWNLSIDYNLYAMDYSKKTLNFKNIYIDGAVF